jgi:hypothetical protein
MMNPTGESESDAVRLDFGRRLMLQFRGSSGIRASFIRTSASSSPTCRARPSGWSPSTTSAARASNGSKKARPRSSGLGCRAGRSRPTRCVSSFMRWPTISATSCARGDARADQRLVADELEGEADQDRREGGEPRTLRRISDGGGRHPTANGNPSSIMTAMPPLHDAPLPAGIR